MFNSIEGNVSLNDIKNVVTTYLDKDEANKELKNLESKYVIPASTFKTTYSGLLKGLLPIYINSFYAINPSLTTDAANPVAVVYKYIVDKTITAAVILIILSIILTLIGGIIPARAASKKDPVIALRTE